MSEARPPNVSDGGNADVVVALVTAPDIDTGARIARTLVEERLVACAALLPGVTSVYRWQGRVETSTEVQLVLKTARARADETVARVRALHPYEVPEILVLPVATGLPAYLGWVAAETTPA